MIDPLRYIQLAHAFDAELFITRQPCDQLHAALAFIAVSPELSQLVAELAA